MIEISIIPPPPASNFLNKKHWSYTSKLRKRILKEVWGQMVGKYVKTPILIHSTRYSVQTMDDGNLQENIKIPVDCLMSIVPIPAGLSEGQWKRWADSSRYVQYGKITQERVGKRKDEKLVLYIEQGVK